jgi:hypothetical protein
LPSDERQWCQQRQPRPPEVHSRLPTARAVPEATKENLKVQTANGRSTVGAEQSLEERYGVPSRRRRLLWFAAVGVLAVGFVGWVVWAGLNQASAGYGATLQSYDVVSEHRVRVQLDIHRSAGQPVICLVTAQASDHAVVGQQQVRVRSGPGGDLSVVADVKTDRRATTALVSQCH